MSEKPSQFRLSRLLGSRSTLRRRNRHSRYRRSQRFESLESRIVLTGHFIDFDLLEPSDYTQSEFLVRFRDGVDVRSMDNFGDMGPFATAPVLSAPLGEGFRSDDQLYEIPVMPGQSVEQLVNYYNGLDIVDFAEPNYRMESAAVPNDQFYGVLWGMEDIGAEAAWDTRTNSESIIVGVIDSGVQYDHPDLEGNIWTNDGEIPNNNIDDDGNGYVDDFYGYDFDNDDSDPMDDNGHGTHVAGTIGAQGNNGIGVAGVGWNASLMSLKVIGTGSNADVARAIDYATENGAKITNNSYGYAGNNVGGSRAISDAIGRAKNAGVLYIVAAGNSRGSVPASDMDGSFGSWPAEYSKVHDNVITVSATDSDGGFASYSHWGDESVQLAAPGTQIGSTYTGDRYVYLSGTSMAAPHVAGAAALLWAEKPDLTYLEVKDALLSTARAEHLDRVGSGVLDLAAAMDLITSSDNGAPTATNDTANVNEDSSVVVNVLANDSDPEDDTLTVQSFTQPTNGTVTNSNNLLTYTPDADFNGSDSFTYVINDGNGNTDSAVVTVTVVAQNDGPVAINDSASTAQNAAITIDVLDNDYDIDGDALSVASVSQPSAGTAVVNNNNTITFTPEDGFSGDATFTYTISDGTSEDTATVTVSVAADTEIGVSGFAVDVTHVWKTINLPVTFDNPVVVAGGSTRDGSHQGVVRVRNVTSNSFQVRFQEWDYRDGNHTTENIGYLVVEAGVHTLPDGTRLAAGTTSLANESWKTVDFGATFSSSPLVLGQVMTNNDPSAVVERIRNINSTRFEIQFNEEEAADGVHASETVGYVAIDRGAAVSGDVSLNAVVTSNSVTHGNTTVNFGSIGGSSNPVILSDMQTRDGGDAATLRHRSQTSTSVTLFVEEEASRDSELSHTSEVAGVLALESGILVSGNPLQASTQASIREGVLANPLDIERISASAMAYWEDRGFDTAPLESVDFQITDLRNSVIGMQVGNSILIDVDAAGHGWFVDADPTTNDSFAGMDLYSTIVHEMGHVLGLSDHYDPANSSDVMYGYLSQGQRSASPSAQSIDAFFQQDDDPLDGFAF